MKNNSVAYSTSAKRTREFRKRKREGVVLARLRISPFQLFALQRLGWLSAADAKNASAIGNAVVAVASAALMRGLRAPPAASKRKVA